MKASNILIFMLPAAALAADVSSNPSAIDGKVDSPIITAPVSLPEGQPTEQLEARQLAQVAAAGAPAAPAAPAAAAADADAADAADAAAAAEPTVTTVPDQWPAPATGTIGMGTLTGMVGATKTIRARSEGTLGQTPWIGMAIGLTFTALAAVMLG